MTSADCCSAPRVSELLFPFSSKHTFHVCFGFSCYYYFPRCMLTSFHFTMCILLIVPS